MPYNYILSDSIRENLHLDLKDAVIIFDEAHNIVDSCEQLASSELTEDTVRKALVEFNQIKDTILKYSEQIKLENERGDMILFTPLDVKMVKKQLDHMDSQFDKIKFENDEKDQKSYFDMNYHESLQFILSDSTIPDLHYFL